MKTRNKTNKKNAQRVFITQKESIIICSKNSFLMPLVGSTFTWDIEVEKKINITESVQKKLENEKGDFSNSKENKDEEIFFNHELFDF